jgi:hypothetical protein
MCSNRGPRRVAQRPPDCRAHVHSRRRRCRRPVGLILAAPGTSIGINLFNELESSGFLDDDLDAPQPKPTKEQAMGLFGHDDEQDDRLDAIERQLRRITEQIGQLSIDLGVTRMELLKTRAAADKSVKSGDLDPLFGQLNDSVTATRAKLEESKAAADDAWVTLQDSSDEALETMRMGIESAWSRLDEGDAG